MKRTLCDNLTLFATAMNDGTWFTSDKLRSSLPLKYKDLNYSQILSRMYLQTDLFERERASKIAFNKKRYKGKYAYRLKQPFSQATLFGDSPRWINQTTLLLKLFVIFPDMKESERINIANKIFEL